NFINYLKSIIIVNDDNFKIEKEGYIEWKIHNKKELNENNENKYLKSPNFRIELEREKGKDNNQSTELEVFNKNKNGYKICIYEDEINNGDFIISNEDVVIGEICIK
ncbi:hypothetical protein PIROE2DRAFT_16731, partial [Piromyces sp. E2]